MSLLLEVEDNALLAAVDKAEVQRLSLGEGTVGTGVVTAAGRFYLDNASTKVD